MENLQVKSLALSQPAGKITAPGEATASDVESGSQTGFQALLQRLMGLETHTEVLATAAQETDRGTGETKDDHPVIATDGIPGTLPLPAMAPAAGVAPQENEVSTCSAAVKADEMAQRVFGSISKPVVDGQKNLVPGVASVAAELQPAVEHVAADKNLPRFLDVESHSELRDGPANPAATHLAQGLHPAGPAHAHSSASAQTRIDTPMGAPGWNTELAQKVVWMAGDKQQMAELRVNPPDLGPLNIRLSMDQHQTNALFTSPHSEVREAIESALPRLREVLAESGITLGNASVTADSPRDGSAFDQSRQSPPAQGSTLDPDATPASEPGPASLHTRGVGLVDLFA